MSQPIVIDTNVALDLFVFDDERARPLMSGLARGDWHWLATPDMRGELARVLSYAHILARLSFYDLQADAVLTQFDAHAHLVAVPDKASVTCRDPDDQKFIDLAVAHRCILLSKDKAVLTMKKRLAALQVQVAASLAALPLAAG